MDYIMFNQVLSKCGSLISFWLTEKAKDPQNKDRENAMNFTFPLGFVGLFNSVTLFSGHLGLPYRLCIQEVRLDGYSKPFRNWSLHNPKRHNFLPCPISHRKELHVSIQLRHQPWIPTLQNESRSACHLHQKTGASLEKPSAQVSVCVQKPQRCLSR